jgi:enoyl-CoA hydratase/carnithine racemase
MQHRIARGQELIMGHIPSELKEDVLRITIDLPQKKNALTGAIDNALADAVAPGEANPDVRVLLLDGNGDSFSAGNDLEDFVANPWKDEIDPPAIRFITSVAHASRPIVAALHRSAVGVGDDSAALRPGLCG